MKKGDIVEFKNPFPNEIGLKYILLEDPDGGRVLAEAIVPMVIRPNDVLLISDIKLVDPATEKKHAED